jgi:hypothetical protein
MGTRSRLQIKRYTKKDIYLWIHFDGYFDGVGRSVCEQVKLLLEKYTPAQVQEMVEALDVHEATKFADFRTEDLIPFIEGKTDYTNNECDDIEFHYTLDFKAGTFKGAGWDDIRGLMLCQIQAGMTFSDVGDPEDRAESLDDVDLILSKYALLSEEKKAFLRSKLT